MQVLSRSMLRTSCSTTLNSGGVYFLLYSQAVIVLPLAFILWPPNVTSLVLDFCSGFLLDFLQDDIALCSGVYFERYFLTIDFDGCLPIFGSSPIML